MPDALLSPGQQCQLVVDAVFKAYGVQCPLFVFTAMCCTYFVLQRHQDLPMLGWNLCRIGSSLVECLQWRLNRK